MLGSLQNPGRDFGDIDLLKSEGLDHLSGLPGPEADDHGAIQPPNVQRGDEGASDLGFLLGLVIALKFPVGQQHAHPAVPLGDRILHHGRDPAGGVFMKEPQHGLRPKLPGTELQSIPGRQQSDEHQHRRGDHGSSDADRASSDQKTVGREADEPEPFFQDGDLVKGGSRGGKPEEKKDHHQAERVFDPESIAPDGRIHDPPGEGRG